MGASSYPSWPLEQGWWFRTDMIWDRLPRGGEESVPLEVTENSRPGQVVLPHGFGLIHQGVKHGANANRLTGSTHRGRLAATPYHRFVSCRVEPLGDEAPAG